LGAYPGRRPVGLAPGCYGLAPSARQTEPPEVGYKANWNLAAGMKKGAWEKPEKHCLDERGIGFGELRRGLRRHLDPVVVKRAYLGTGVGAWVCCPPSLCVSGGPPGRPKHREREGCLWGALSPNVETLGYCRDVPLGQDRKGSIGGSMRCREGWLSRVLTNLLQRPDNSRRFWRQICGQKRVAMDLRRWQNRAGSSW
jgi:hypothetical protein